jgi:hypothetical protein
MKPTRILLVLFVVAAISFVVFRFIDRSQSPQATAKFEKFGLEATVNYCQPAKKGRIIFAEDGLVRYGKVWRTGANEATTVSFNRDVQFAGKQVNAGTYSFWTVPSDSSWTVILNSETAMWGTEYELHKSKDVLRAEVPSGTSPDVVEKLKIDFKEMPGGAMMILHWDMTEVAVPILIK